MGSKDIDQLREEMTATLTEYLRVNGMNLAYYDSGANFTAWWTGDPAATIVAMLTGGWKADKTMLDLDKDKILRDPTAPLENEGDDYDTSKAEKVVVYEVSTAHRPLTDAERAALQEREERWQADLARRQARHRWELGNQDSPPPDGTPIGTLLEHHVWWVTKDKRAIRIAEMEPSHRANLFRLMLRNADAWKEVELHRFLAQGAPDDVTSSAEYLTGKNWLAEKPLFQALRKLVLTDQVGVDTCLIEWFDDKPVGCLTGADGHVCVLDAGHGKRCSCRCGARPAKKSAAVEKARAARQQALVEGLFPAPSPSTGKTVQQETAERFMNLNATERMGLDPETDDDMQIVHPERARQENLVERYLHLRAEDIH